jgi:uncharacterized protein with von Willebrand factor type A (vWA) domain
VSDGDFVVHLALFARALRERGIAVGLSDEVDGLTALTHVDVSDRAEVHRALLTALKIRRRDREGFDELFERFWAAEAAGASPVPRPATLPPSDRSGPLGRTTRGHSFGESGRESGSNVHNGKLPGYSAEVLLRRKPFDECSAADLAAMERLLVRLASKLATRRSRRRVPSRGRGAPDLRRSFRRAIATGGEFLSLARRARAVEEPRLVVLCDTSGSMDSHSRFLLAFVLSLKRAARRTEVFAFNTSLSRLTPWISPQNMGRTLDRLAAGVPDWSGGTRIGECLAEFVARYQDEMVNSKTVVLIFSDGLDRGDTALLASSMRAIRAKARKVIWLNPLLGDTRYEPIARGMEAALPFVDLLAPAHNLESLERLLPDLGWGRGGPPSPVAV